MRMSPAWLWFFNQIKVWAQISINTVPTATQLSESGHQHHTKKENTKINEHILSIDSCVFKWKTEGEIGMKNSQIIEAVHVGMIEMR